MSTEVKKPRLVKVDSEGNYEPNIESFCTLLEMFVEGFYADVEYELSTPSSYDDPGDGGYVSAEGTATLPIAKIREQFRLSKSDFDAVMDILKFDLDEYESTDEGCTLEDYIMGPLRDQTEEVGPYGFSIDTQILDFEYLEFAKVIKMTYTVSDYTFDESEYRQNEEDCRADEEYDRWRDDQLFGDD